MSDQLASLSPLVPLGRTGISVSPIAWGMWRFGRQEIPAARGLVEAAFEAGVTLFDTADIYGFDGSSGFGDAESLLGQVLAEAPKLRDRMVLATKGGITPPVPYNSSTDYLTQALENSLKRLRTEQIDLYQIHRPDILTHPEEVARALENMISSGKVRAIGVSNYSVAQTRAIAELLAIPLASHQPEFSPLHLDPMTDGLFDLAMQRGFAILAWSPLGGGRIGQPEDDRSRAVAQVLDRKANEAEVSRAAAAYSWIMAHPARPIPIVGTQTRSRIAEIADAFKPRWNRKDWYDVLVASRGETLP
jgi:predicted oxidoreductase